MRKARQFDIFSFLFLLMGFTLTSSTDLRGAEPHDESEGQAIRFYGTELHDSVSSFLNELKSLNEFIIRGTKEKQIIFINGKYETTPGATEEFTEGLGLVQNRREQLIRAKDHLEKIQSLSNVRAEDKPELERMSKALEETMNEVIKLTETKHEGVADALRALELQAKLAFTKLHGVGVVKLDPNGNISGSGVGAKGQLDPVTKNKLDLKLKELISEAETIEDVSPENRAQKKALLEQLKTASSALQRTTESNLSLLPPENRLLLPPTKNSIAHELNNEIYLNEIKQEGIKNSLNSELSADLRSQYEDNLRKLNSNHSKLLDDLMRFAQNTETPARVEESPTTQPTVQTENSTPPSTVEEKQPPLNNPKPQENLNLGNSNETFPPKGGAPNTIARTQQGTPDSKEAQRGALNSATTRVSGLDSHDLPKAMNAQRQAATAEAKSTLENSRANKSKTNNAQKVDLPLNDLESKNESSKTDISSDSTSNSGLKKAGERFFSPFSKQGETKAFEISSTKSSKVAEQNNLGSSDLNFKDGMDVNQLNNQKNFLNGESTIASLEDGFSLRKQEKRRESKGRKNEDSPSLSIVTNTVNYQTTNYSNESKPITKKPDPPYIKNLDGTYSKDLTAKETSGSNARKLASLGPDIDLIAGELPNDSIKKIDKDINSSDETKQMDTKVSEEDYKSLWSVIGIEPRTDSISKILAEIYPSENESKTSDISEWMGWKKPKSSYKKVIPSRKISSSTEPNQTYNLMGRIFNWLGIN